MPWPKLKVRFNKSFGSCPRETTIEDKETGITQTKIEDCNKPLPDAENFEIAKQIEAGLNLKEVNTKIIGNPIDTAAIEEAVTKINNQKKTTTEE